MEVKDTATTEGICPDEEELNDLPVADEQSDETKAGGTRWGTAFSATGAR